MTIAIMQPYFFPYIGYFQLLNAVDEFVIYDNIEFAKKGWINRNRILVNGKDAYISLPLKKDSDYLDIKDRFLADTWSLDRKKMLNRITESYRKAPFYKDVFPIIESCLLYEDSNLFGFLHNALVKVATYIGIKTKIIISSSLDINYSLKSADKVKAICHNRNAKRYINPIGGLSLYNKNNFSDEGIDLLFLQSIASPYKQFSNEYVPWLSIIDLMMFNDVNQLNNMISNEYFLV